jgi:O-antigen ligase
VCQYREAGQRKRENVTIQMLLAVACAPLLVAFVVACFRDPLRYALPPYAVLVPFSSLLSVAPGPFGSVSTVLGLLLGVALLVQLVTTRRAAPSIYPAIPIWLAFLGLCGLSLYWSIAPRATADDFILLAAQVLLFVALVLSRVDAVALRRFENAIVLSGVLVICYGLAQLFFLGGLPTGGSGSGRFGEDLLGANNQAAALLLPLALVAHRAMTGPRNRRLLYTAATVLVIFGVLMTGSRGGLVSGAITLFALMVFGAVRRAVAVTVIAAAAVVVTVVLLLNPAGVGARHLNQAESSSGRAEIWTVGLYSCPKYCIDGAGWGTFPTVYRQELASVPDARILAQGTSYEAHNIFLLALVELGIPGLVLLLIGLAIPLVDTARMPAALRGPPFGALVGTVISSFFLSNLEFKFFWVVLAYVALASLAPVVEREKADAGTPLDTPLGAPQPGGR